MRTGKTILVTRPAHQSEKLCHLIEQQGWKVLRYPVIDIHALELSIQDKRHIQHIEQYQYVFFVSANAVNFALPIFNGKIESLQKVLCIAVGKVTCAALSDHGIRSALVPVEGFNSEAILAMPELQTLEGHCCLIIRGEGGRELLANTLRERGAKVDYLQVYKRVIPRHDNRIVESYLLNKTLSAVFIYSGEALKHLVQMMAKQEIIINLLNVPLVVISLRVQVLAKKIGFKKIIIADEASDVAMINALLNGEECG